MAATPEAIVLMFDPVRRHVSTPEAEAQKMDLPAAVSLQARRLQ